MRGARTRRFAIAAAAAWLVGCAPDPHQSVPSSAPRSVAAHIAALEAEIARESPPAPNPTDAPESLRSTILRIERAQRDVRRALLDDVRALGDSATPRLVTLLSDPSADDAFRLAVLEALGAIDTPRAAAVLAGFVESSPQSWIRAQCAFQLGRMHDDVVVTRLLARLPHETDAETTIWIADTLGRFGNWAGLDALAAIARRGSTAARERQEDLASFAGFANAGDLAQSWKRADGRVREVAPSKRLQLAVWRTITSLASEDARTASDARFVLGHSAAWVVEPLCQALDDTDLRVRAGVLASLRDLGPRARTAGAALMRVVNDPSLLPATLEALGAIGHVPARKRIVEELERRDNEVRVRVSAAHALGWLALPASIPALTAAMESNEPRAVRHAAAVALAALDRARDAAPVLADALVTDGEEASASEAALERWLERDSATDGALRELYGKWKALEGPPGIGMDDAEVRERRAKRAELVRRATR